MIKSLRTPLVLLILVSALPLSQAGAAGHKKSKAEKNICILSETSVDSLYDKNTVVHFEGEVETIVEIPIPKNMRGSLPSSSDVHLTLTSNGRNYKLHVGPKWFIEKSGFILKIGDKVYVEASAMENCGEGILVAGKISKNSSTLELRDNDGKAKWLVAKR